MMDKKNLDSLQCKDDGFESALTKSQMQKLKQRTKSEVAMSVTRKGV